MKKIASIALVLFTITFAITAISEDLVITFNNGEINIPLDPNSTVEVKTTSGANFDIGDVTAQTTESGEELCQRLKSQVSAITCTGPVPDPVVTLSVDDNVLISGTGTTTLRWTISNSETCTRSGEWGNANHGTVSGNQSIGPFTGPDTLTYGLTCENSEGDQRSASVNVTITDPNGLNCAVDFPPILGGAEDVTVISNGTLNAGVYNGLYSDIYGVGAPQTYPGLSGQKWHLSLEKNKYIAAEFNLDSNAINKQGIIAFGLPNSLEGSGSTAMTIAISECPGDFSEHSGQVKCRILGGALPTLRWSSKDPNISTNPQPISHCILEQGKTYYLNFVSSNSVGDNFATSACPHATYCGILGQNTF